MAGDSNVEREYKFDVDVRFEVPDLRGLVRRMEKRPEQVLVSSYFDTVDHRLWAHRMTLRHRGEGTGGAEGPGKWTLKLPEPAGPADGRAAQVRTELSWAGSCAAVPAPVAAVVAGVVRHRPLVPLAVLESVRRGTLLHAAKGTAPWAEIDDDTVIVTAGRQEGLRFRQIEVELLGPPPQPATLTAVLDRLASAGAAASAASKVGLAAGLEAPPGSEAAGDRASAMAALLGGDAASAVAVLLGVGLDRLVAADVGLRVALHGGGDAALDAGALREAQRAADRLRTYLDPIADLLEPRWWGDVAGELDHFGRRLGRLAGHDGLVEAIRAYAADPDARAELSDLVGADRRRGESELAAYMGSGAYIDTLERLCGAREHPPVPAGSGDRLSPSAAVVAAAERAWRDVIAGIEVLEAEGASRDSAKASADGPATRRDLTIQAGRLRAAARAAIRFAGRPARRTARAARRLQVALEESDRGFTIGEELYRLAVHPSVRAAVAYEAGRIAARVEAESDTGRDRWRQAALQLRKRSPSKWPSA